MYGCTMKNVRIKEDPLRKLAGSRQWIMIYLRAKEIGSIHLFDNTTDFSHIQLIFLQYLELYSNLYNDLAMGEEFLIEETIQDELRANAYLAYKTKKKEEAKFNKENKQEENSPSKDRIVFLRRNKKDLKEQI